jgi:diacylglycerol kinase (ATP)
VGQVNDRYFVNNSAVGLEAVVTANHAEMRWLNGNARYVVAALKTIAKAKSWEMKISWPSGQYEGPVTLVSIGNNRRTGGSFIMTPHAVLDDGLLDFVYSMDLNRWQMVQLLPKTFSGDHIHHPMVNYKQASFLSITSSSPTPVQADGEIIATDVTELTYQIDSRKLRVIV